MPLKTQLVEKSPSLTVSVVPESTGSCLSDPDFATNRLREGGVSLVISLFVRQSGGGLGFAGPTAKPT